MIEREIPLLRVTLMKLIAKAPKKYISEEAMESSLGIMPDNQHDSVIQELIDYITDAGRMTDDVIPPNVFRSSLRTLSLKNSKVTSKYMQRVVERCQDIRMLDLTGCFQVDDDAVAFILKSCSKLESAIFRNCRKVSY